MAESEQIKRYKLESQLKALVKEGATLREIAIRLGCSQQTVRRELRKVYGAPKSPKGGILEWLKSLWASESFQKAVERGEVVLPPTGSLKISDCFCSPAPPPIYQDVSHSGLRREYSSKQYLEERNARLSGSLASSGGESAIRSSSQNPLPCGGYVKAPFWQFRRS